MFKKEKCPKYLLEKEDGEIFNFDYRVDRETFLTKSTMEEGVVEIDNIHLERMPNAKIKTVKFYRIRCTCENTPLKKFSKDLYDLEKEKTLLDKVFFLEKCISEADEMLDRLNPLFFKNAKLFYRNYEWFYDKEKVKEIIEAIKVKRAPVKMLPGLEKPYFFDIDGELYESRTDDWYVFLYEEFDMKRDWMMIDYNKE